MSITQHHRLTGARRLAVLALVALAALFASHVGPASAGPSAFQACPSGALCLYKSKNLNAGTTQKPDAIYKKCRVVNLKGWTSRHGSYLDNQTGSPTTAFFAGYGGAGKILRSTTPWRGLGVKSPTNSIDNDFNFYPVNSIRVC